jgi:mono/diheme cytochrome c family protein
MKNIFISGHTIRSVFVITMVMVLNGCDRPRTDTGWDYFPDMFYSTAYETYTRNPNFKDGMTERVPVEGTVPRDFTPFHYTVDPESRILAGKELVNPFTAGPENLARGKEVFSTFCLVCHGADGKGDGQLYSSGLYPLQPHDLTDSETVNLKDGELFHTITLGFGSMGAHGTQIRPDDRWKLVLYVRDLQREAGRTAGEDKK